MHSNLEFVDIYEWLPFYVERHLGGSEFFCCMLFKVQEGLVISLTSQSESD